jgi:hypothetical protein
VASQERDILERAARTLSEQAAKADELVNHALIEGLDGSHPLTVQAKMLRLELLKVKADMERELGQFVLDCSRCGQTVHWVAGLGVQSRALGVEASPGSQMLFLTARPHWEMKLANGANTGLAQHLQCSLGAHGISRTPRCLTGGGLEPASRGSTQHRRPLGPGP